MGDEESQRQADATQASVDAALAAMGAPDYTPPADDVGGSIGEHAGSDAIEITTNRADGSQTHESIDMGSLNYESMTQYQDGSYDVDRVTGGQTYEQHTDTDPDGTQHSQSTTQDADGRTELRDLTVPGPDASGLDDL
jgi:hypothetical protein